MPGPIGYAIDDAGNPVALQEQQAQTAVDRGWAPVSGDEAGQLAQAQQDAKTIDSYGTLGTTALGLGDGLTLGLGGAMATHGLVTPGQLDALGNTTGYQVGNVAGTLLPAFLTGGDSLLARGALGGAEVAGEAGGRSAIAQALALGTPAGLMGEAGGLTERALTRFLPESAILGKSGAGIINMAARGATEGALMNLAHQTSQDMIQDKPLTAQALLASGVDGALFGSLVGGGIGAVTHGLGSLGGSAKRAVGRGAEGALGRQVGERAGARALERVGTDLGEAAQREAGLGTLEKYALGESNRGPLASQTEKFNNVLSGSGVGWKSTTQEIQAGLEKHLNELKAVEQDTLRQMGEGPDGLKQRLYKRIKDGIDTDYSNRFGDVQVREAFKDLMRDFNGSPEVIRQSDKFKAMAREHNAALSDLVEAKSFATQARSRFKKLPKDASGNDWHRFREAAVDAETKVADLKERAKTLKGSMKEMLQSGGPKSWEDWARSRESLADVVRNAPADSPKGRVYGMALNALDDEMVHAGTAADEALFKKYAAAAAQKGVAKNLLSDLGNRLTKEAKNPSWAQVANGDVGILGFGAVSGNPVGALGMIAGRKIAGYAQEKLQPVLAEYAARSALGSSAASATAKVNTDIQGAMQKFMLGTPRRAAEMSHAGSPKVSYTMKSYQDVQKLVDHLTSVAHQQKVQDLASDVARMGHPELGNELVNTYMRAAGYINANQPKGNRGKEYQMGTLRKLPAQHGLSTEMQKFMRITAAIGNPVGRLVDGLEKGDLSRDEVAAIKYVYPDIHHMVVSNFANTSMEMKQAGKYLPADKLAMAGVVLDAPVDTTLQKDFIDAIQQSYAQQAQEEQQKQGSPPEAQGGPDVNFQTPLQSVMS